jgi:hypothetical protein
MKTLAMIALSLLLASAAQASEWNEGVQLKTKVTGKKCYEFANQGVYGGPTTVEGHGYRKFEFSEEVMCYKYDATLPRAASASPNPEACFCDLDVTIRR